jgi:amino acid adenylation domain-containing protein
MAVPLASLISRISMDWRRPIREGDRLRASARQVGVTDTLDRRGRRLILIDAETQYWNQDDELVGVALGTLARVARDDGELLLDRGISRYEEAQRGAIRDALEAEARRGPQSRVGREVWVGQPLPVFVRGPLTVGDLVCWQAAIGPSYRAGALAYRDLLDAPHHAAVNPMTGWPVKYSQQHEDFLMAEQRGMPAPFDNSLMRFAWIAPMLTDWAGDEGVLARLAIQTDAPLLYGDTTWYRGIVSGKRPADRGDGTVVTIRIAGVNQLGQGTTSGEADVVLPARRRRVVAPAARTGAAREPGVLDLLHAHAESRPDAVAVECGETRLTYAELDRRVRLGAQALAQRGAEPGAPVALALDRSVDAVVAILAVLEAGCPYLPIDPGWRDEERRRVLAAAEPGLVLDADACRALGIEGAADAAAAAGVPGDGRAYLMPTSGTTSVPRLVAVGHASLNRYVRSLPAALGTRPDDVYVHTAAFTFSASVRQLFLPLTTGARLVMATDHERLDPFALWPLIKARRVTVWDTVPSIWAACLEAFRALPHERRADLLTNDLRLILTTGERLPWSVPRRWRDELGHPARCVNLYSQTETAGTVCVYHVPGPADGDASGSVPLGTPLPHVRVEVLDERLQPVADGEAGELCVGGGQLASGYVGDAGLSAERFVLRPFCHDGFYRTGDLARRRPDGALEFAGRRDDRVKIRGQRVDLGEVEDALRSLAVVADAAVTVHERDGAIARLVAWIVTEDGRPAAAGDLLAHLRQVLPSAALPAAFVPIDRLPRNAAGKVDRQALPDPAGTLPPDDSEATRTSSALADRVGKIFAEALSLRRVGSDDDFFDLGGNSLLATVLIARLDATFGVPVPIARFFERPTVRAVAAVVEEQLIEDVESLTEEEAARLLGDDAAL